MKTLNGYEVVDEKARQDIETLKNKEVDLTGYATEDWVNNQGFIKEHQSLEGYATEKYVDDAIANIDIPEGGDKEVFYIDTRTDAYVSVAENVKEAYDAGEHIAVYIYISGGTIGTTGYYPAHIREEAETLTLVAETDYYFSMIGNVKQKVVTIKIDGNVFTYDEKEFETLTETKVNSLIETALNEIGVAEGGSY